MQGSQTITVIAEVPRDRNGDPIVDPDVDPPEDRDIPSCVLIPRTHPDDETIIVDGYQVVMTDTSVDPPEAEDAIKIPDNRFIDADKSWFIDGGIGPYTKPDGSVRAITFFIKSVR